MALAHRTLIRQAADRYAVGVLRAGLELGLVFALFQLYRVGRLLTEGHELAAREHAVDVHHLERLLHLPSEAWLQSVAGTATVLHLANVYYVSGHFPVMIAFLVWGYLFRSRREHLWARNLVIAMTTTGGWTASALPPCWCWRSTS
jgi:PAP2 superfamily